MIEIVIATKNVHKFQEIKSILKSALKVEMDIYSLRDFPEYTPPEEIGESFKSIAEAKAISASKALGKIAIADDSGLVVPALGNAPGIHSRRFAKEDATDKENREKLIHQLHPLAEEERSGYFECALAIATPEGALKSVTGYCEGMLITTPRGGNGFGYDPLFIKYDYSKTLSELDSETKNRISHRRKAIDKILPYLEQILEDELTSQTS